MKTVYAVLDTVNSIEIGQQYDHKATYVQFTNVNYQGTVYIRVEIGDYRNMIPLVDYGLIIGRPLTNQSGAVRAQLYAMTEDGDYEELSKVFNMIIKPSIGYSDPTDYPVEPNIEYIYNELLASKEASASQTQACLEQTQACQEATQNAISESSNLSQLKADCETAKTECVNATSDCTEITETAEVYVPQAQQIVETWQDVDVSGVAVNGVQSTNSTFSGETSNCGVELKKIVGKTVQNGTPSPDSPVEIENVKITDVTSHGRQLFDQSKLPTKSQGGATVTNNGDGSFTVSGSGNLTETFNLYFNYTKEETKKLLKVGTLYAKADKVTFPAFGFLIYSNGGWTELNLYRTTSRSIEITDDMLNADDLYSRIRFYETSGFPPTTGIIKPMLYQEGDGTWEPYHADTVETNLTLAEGDTYENGQITRVRKQVTFDGSSDENWSMDQSESVYRFFINVSDSLNSDGRSEVKCNRGMFNNNNNNNIGTIFIIKKICYYIPPQDITTVEAFKTWLSTNNLVVEYELETPTTEEFKIPTIPSYEPYTQISTNSVVDPTITFRPLPFTECSGRLQELYEWYLKVIAGQTSVLIDTEEGS